MCGPSKTCHYGSLGLTTTASQSDIKTAFRKAIIQYHPDKLVGASGTKKAEGEAKSKLLNAAWACLGDKNSQVLFDLQCARSTSEASVPHAHSSLANLLQTSLASSVAMISTLVSQDGKMPTKVLLLNVLNAHAPLQSRRPLLSPASPKLSVATTPITTMRMAGHST